VAPDPASPDPFTSEGDLSPPEGPVEGAAPARDAPVPVPVPVPAPGEGTGHELVRLALPFYGLVALFAFGYALFTNHLATLFGEAAPTGPHLVVAAGVGLALVPLARVGARAWRPMTRAVDALAGFLGRVGLLEALLLALLSGLAEELLFRGALWPNLGLLGTTLLFGLVHVIPKRSLWVMPLFATLAGLLLGLLRLGTESVWPPVLAHVLVNALNLAWLGARGRRAKDG